MKPGGRPTAPLLVQLLTLTGLTLVAAWAMSTFLLFNLPPPATGVLFLSLLLGTPAVSAIGAIGASLTLSLKRGGLILPLIILPLLAPVVIFGAGAVEAVLSGLGGVQNALILLSSYVFYGWWGYGFLFLLAFSTFLDYFSGLRIYNAKSLRTKKTWLFLSVFINIGFLCFFKYFNFLAGSLAGLLGSVNVQPLEWKLRGT